ncbi:hypothetical protein F0249_16895 [Vibrio sp. 03-59-1]|nr:hypothetical protein [Vibrio sp. 03-59-1]
MAMSYALSNSGDIDEFHTMLANNTDFSSDKIEKNADSVGVENKTGVTNKPDGVIPTIKEADPETLSTLKSTNQPKYTKDGIKEIAQTNGAGVQADSDKSKMVQKQKADEKFAPTNQAIDKGKAEIQEKSDHIMDEKMAYQAKEMGAAMLDWVGHNLTTSQLAEHYQGFKEMFGGDVADAVFNDYKGKYNNPLPIQALQSIDGQGVNSQPVTQEAILDKFDSKIEDEQKQSEVAQRMTDDTYLDADSRAVYQSQADKHSEMADALEAEKMNVVNNQPYTLNPELDSDKDDHRSELKGKIMSLNGLNEKLDTIQENNPTMVGGYYTDLQNSNNEAIAFYSEQIENLDNGKPYRLDINDEQASGNTDIDVPTFMPEVQVASTNNVETATTEPQVASTNNVETATTEPQVASTNNVEINNDSDDFLETEPDDHLENFKLS